MEKYYYPLNVLNYAIYQCVKRKEFLAKDSRKKMPYKCRTKTDAIRRRRENNKDIKQENMELIQLRSAVKLLTKAQAVTAKDNVA